MKTRLTEAMNGICGEAQLTSFLRPGTVKAFLAGQSETSYPQGRVLLVEGEVSGGIYVVRSGSVRVFRMKNCHAGSSRIARRGAVLGLSNVVSGRPWEATAETMSRARVAFMPKDHLMKLMQRDAEFAYRVVHVLSETLPDPFDRFRPPHHRRRRPSSGARS